MRDEIARREMRPVRAAATCARQRGHLRRQVACWDEKFFLLLCVRSPPNNPQDGFFRHLSQDIRRSFDADIGGCGSVRRLFPDAADTPSQGVEASMSRVMAGVHYSSMFLRRHPGSGREAVVEWALKDGATDSQRPYALSAARSERRYTQQGRCRRSRDKSTPADSIEEKATSFTNRAAGSILAIRVCGSRAEEVCHSADRRHLRRRDRLFRQR